MGKLICLTVLLVMGGCGMLAMPQADFGREQENFAQRLRWLDINDAARFIEPQFRKAFIEQFTTLEGLHITEVRSIARPAAEEPPTMASQVEIDFYRLPSVTVQTRQIHLVWHYRGGDRWHPGTWLIEGPFPPFP